MPEHAVARPRCTCSHDGASTCDVHPSPTDELHSADDQATSPFPRSDITEMIADLEASGDPAYKDEIADLRTILTELKGDD